MPAISGFKELHSPSINEMEQCKKYLTCTESDSSALIKKCTKRTRTSSAERPRCWRSGLWQQLVPHLSPCCNLSKAPLLLLSHLLSLFPPADKLSTKLSTISGTLTQPNTDLRGRLAPLLLRLPAILPPTR